MLAVTPILTCLILVIYSTVFADFSGPVVSILDGDTIEVLHNRQPERIRLSGIDCPQHGTANLRADCSRPEVWPGFMSVRPPFMGLVELTARDSDRSPSPQYDHPA